MLPDCKRYIIQMTKPVRIAIFINLSFLRGIIYSPPEIGRNLDLCRTLSSKFSTQRNETKTLSSYGKALLNVCKIESVVCLYAVSKHDSFT